MLRISTCVLAIAISVILAACGSSPRPTYETQSPQRGVTYGTLPPLPEGVPGAEEIEAEVRALLAAQADDWNAGNIRGFMDGYTRTDSLYFISNGTLRPGWQNTYYAYVRNYPDRAAMGTLSFEDLHVKVLAENAVLVFGRYRLVRENDEPLGLFSLVLHKEPAGWRIIHDHTSSSP